MVLHLFLVKCVCLGGWGPRLQRYVTQEGQAFECYGALRGGVGGQNRKFLRYVFFERPLCLFDKILLSIVSVQLKSVPISLSQEGVQEVCIAANQQENLTQFCYLYQQFSKICSEDNSISTNAHISISISCTKYSHFCHLHYHICKPQNPCVYPLL